ncbi:isopenicillin N synthase family oxygenase, partial [Escherichia coli]|nr:isopenicillin N synthase family oxygenase [Escherichia coli]
MTNTSAYALHELSKESRMGARGVEAAREVRIIDLTDFDQRKEEIADQVWQAA